MKELLEKRKATKSKKPKFVMQDAHKLSRLKSKWKRPRGIDSKMRLNLKGYNKNVEPGYGSPKEIKGVTKTGLYPTVVANEKQVEQIDIKKQGAILSASLGKRKKIVVIKKCLEKSIKILNLKDPEKYIKDIEADFEKRKQEKKKKVKEKTEKKAKVKEDKLTEKVLSEEEKAAKEKEEKDKLLTKKDL